jgi:hypothetical protein
MRIVLLVVLSGVLAAGCGGKQASAVSQGSEWPEVGTPSNTSAPKTKPVVTPDQTLTGRILSVNAIGRFVVVNFPIGHLPVKDQQLYIYRQGLKVGELKVTEWQYDDNVVADITVGEAKESDEVRDR